MLILASFYQYDFTNSCHQGCYHRTESIIATNVVMFQIKSHLYVYTYISMSILISIDYVGHCYHYYRLKISIIIIID